MWLDHLSRLGYLLRSLEVPNPTAIPGSSLWLAPDPIRLQSAPAQALHVNVHSANILLGFGYRLYSLQYKGCPLFDGAVAAAATAPYLSVSFPLPSLIVSG